MTPLALVLLGCRTQPQHLPTADGCIPGDPGPTPPLVVSVSKSLPQGAFVIDVNDRQTGAALAFAELHLVSPSRSTHTDAQGNARFDSLPSGLHVLTTRRLGYVNRTDTVLVAQNAGQRAKISLRRKTICSRGTAADERTVTPSVPRVVVEASSLRMEQPADPWHARFARAIVFR